MAKITEKQKRFADYYIQTGNASESARKAGYSNSYATTHVYKLLENARIREYIDERNKQLENERIADMQEVKEFWTKILRDDEAEYKDSLKASEYIAKTNGAFLERVEQTGKDGGPIETKQKVDFSDLSDEELNQLDELIDKTSKDNEG